MHWGDNGSVNSFLSPEILGLGLGFLNIGGENNVWEGERKPLQKEAFPTYPPKLKP